MAIVGIYSACFFTGFLLSWVLVMPFITAYHTRASIRSVVGLD